MRNTFKIILILILTLSFTELTAGTLLDSLNSAYLNNPKLNAERANVRAINEEKEEALSEFRPSFTIYGYVSEQDNTKGSESNYKPSEQSLLIEQKIFQGFGGIANLKKKKYEYSLAKFRLQKIEQEILLAAVEVHANLLLSQKKFDINTSLYKINYYGDPKKLSDEFYSFDYHLRDNKGYWELEIND